MTPTGYLLLGAAVGVIVSVTFFRFLMRALRSEHDEKDWLRGSATVLEFRRWQGSQADAPHGSYVVRARLVTADGREASAWAEGNYTGADRWVGGTRPAWHHPEQIERFRLIEPRGALIGFLRLLPAVLVLLVVLSVFGFVAHLQRR